MIESGSAPLPSIIVRRRVRAMLLVATMRLRVIGCWLATFCAVLAACSGSRDATDLSGPASDGGTDDEPIADARTVCGDDELEARGDAAVEPPPRTCVPALFIPNPGTPRPCDQSGNCIPKTLALACVGGTCVSYGTEGAPCLSCETAALDWCAPGLGCKFGVCVRALSPGAPCVVDGPEPCPDGEACVASRGEIAWCTPFGRAAGFPCGPGGTCSDGLECASVTDGSGVRACLHLAAPNESCRQTLGWKCAGDATCILDRPDDPLIGTCRQRGTLGGECAMTGDRCVQGECFLERFPTTCALSIEDGGECDPMGRTRVCRGGSACVPDANGHNTCRAWGSAAGAPCLASPALCTAPLACTTHVPLLGDLSQWLFASPTCTREVTSTCNPRSGTDRCSGTTVCVATSFTTGRCLTPTSERADAYESPMVIVPPAVIAGTLSGSDDPRDCFAFDVPCEGSVFAEVNDGMGGTLSFVDLTLLDPFGRTVASAKGSSPTIRAQAIVGTSPASDAHALHNAGRYTLCLSTNLSSTFKYFVDISVH